MLLMLHACPALYTAMPDHSACAGSASRSLPRLSERLSPATEFKEWEEQTGYTGSAAEQEVYNVFRADTGTQRKSQLFDINGVVTVLCR